MTKKFFSWIEQIFLVIILCQLKFSEILLHLHKIKSFILKCKVLTTENVSEEL